MDPYITMHNAQYHISRTAHYMGIYPVCVYTAYCSDYITSIKNIPNYNFCFVFSMYRVHKPVTLQMSKSIKYLNFESEINFYLNFEIRNKFLKKQKNKII